MYSCSTKPGEKYTSISSLGFFVLQQTTVIIKIAIMKYLISLNGSRVFNRISFSFMICSYTLM